jgi:adenylate cyclase
MADIFFSYSRQDRALAEPIIAALEAEGWSVWWDRHIGAGEEFDARTARELADARAAVVLWTPRSVASRWVKGEARAAADRNALVPVRVENADLPLDVRAIQTTDLDEWKGDRASPVFRTLCQALAAKLGATARPAATPAPAGVGVCVLPFANMSGDPEQDYFSDGVTEDIITDLSKVSALAVTARHTAFAYRGKSVDIPHIARQLRVSHVLEGSVRKAGARVRITAQLIDGASGNHVWAERYDRDLSDIFALQDEISEAIVAALKLKLLPEEKKAIEARGTTNPEAYKLYLMARQFLVKTNERHRPLVIRLCKRAVELDPNYARAWALLAIGQSNYRLLSLGREDNGWQAATRALALDDGLAEAHAAKGRILSDQGRYEEALAELDIALRLDPYSYDVNCAAARCFTAVRRFDDAVRYYARAASLVETEFWASGMSMQCHEALGDREALQRAARDTLARVEKAVAAEPDNGPAMSFGVFALVVLGERERAMEWTERALLLCPDDVNLRYNLGCTMLKNGAVDRGLDLIEALVEKCEIESLIWMERDCDLDSVRGHPRFLAMMARAKARLGATG